jgi:hypothetical protein
LTDYGEDPACSSPVDGDEAGSGASECSDGIDNDGDGDVDWPADRGCSGVNDPREFPDIACQDGIDNDGDGAIDYGQDLGCASSLDGDESSGTPECRDGIDNDGDGAIDMADFGCSNPDDQREFPNPRCSDGIDNDGDTFTDFPADPECASESDTREDI